MILLSEQQPAGALPYRITDWAACERFRGEPPQREWLVRGVFPRSKPALVASAGGIGKSFLMLELCRTIASGIGKTPQAFTCPPLFGGQPATAGAVVYITAEDDAIEAHSRLASLGPIPRNLFVVPLPDAGGTRPLFQSDRGGVVLLTAAWLELCEQLRRIEGLALVVLDPLQPLAACDLNDASAAQAVCSALAALGAQTGASVIITHHFAKNRDISTPAQAREAVRGSGGLIDGVRAAYALWPAPDKQAREICRALEDPHQPDKVIFGSVVKANGAANRAIQTYLRSATGLLVDRTQERRAANPTESDLLPALVAAIERAAADGLPYTKTGQNGLYSRRAELPEAFHQTSRARLETMADELLSAGQIIQAKGPNSTTVKWLDVPGGSFANGEGEFRQGHLAREGDEVSNAA